MAELLTIENVAAFAVLLVLQVILGLDNLLSISLESQRAPVAQQRALRFWGLALAFVLRVVLLFVVLWVIESLETPLVVFGLTGVLEGGVSLATLLYLLGAVLLIYRAVKEIAHLQAVDYLDHDLGGGAGGSSTQVLVTLLVVNAVASFEAVMAGIAVTEVFLVVLLAVVIASLVMLLLSETVTQLLESSRLVEVVGLFGLLLVGVLLLGQAGPAAAEAANDPELQLRILGTDLTPMSKATFYLALIVLVGVALAQAGYQRRLAAERHAEQRR